MCEKKNIKEVVKHGVEPRPVQDDVSGQGLELIIADAYNAGYEAAVKKMMTVLRDVLYDEFYSNINSEEKIQRVLAHVVAKTQQKNAYEFAENYIRKRLLMFEGVQ